jgi:hypothetical protein
MRTCESNLNLLSAALREAYTNDDGEDRANIEKYWNGAMKQVGIRHCMYMTQTTPEPPKVSVNGKEARKVEEDFAKLRGIDAQACVAKGEFPSVIVQGYYNAALACGLDVENLDQIIEVLAHWSSVAEIMRMMKPTPSDREKFRRECRLYRAKKMVVWGAGCWYDRLMHILPTLLDKYHTLGALSQQSMEGNQNFTQHDLRHAGFGSAGRPKKKDIAAGAERWAQVLAERRAAADSPEKWMWEAAVLRFITERDHAWLLALVDKLRDSGQMISQKDLTPLWNRFQATCHAAIRWMARVRIRWARSHGTVGEWSSFYALLRIEHSRYYADPTDYSYQRPEDARKSLIRERKDRFAARAFHTRASAAWPTLRSPWVAALKA